ncbi:UNVERIFIED_ORG: mannonate dehydratase [Martelella mediterranea]
MKIAMCLEPAMSPKWHYGREMCVEDAVALRDQTPDVPIWDLPTLARSMKAFEDFGYKVRVLEGWVPMENFKLGKPEGEQEMQQMLATIENMGALGIETLCYSWMVIHGWMRTSVTERLPGGALTTSYDHSIIEKDPRSHQGIIVSEDQLWTTLEAFLKRAVPVAEKAGVKLAMHPDDPPLSPIMGVSRIMSSVSSFERLLKLNDSPANGITFCQANFAAMDADVPAAIRNLGKDGRIHFVHFRDVEGDARNLRETFHGMGKTDMYETIKAYMDIGFDGVMRPDHAPVMYGEPNANPGYEGLGRIYAIGYMRGLIEAAAKERAR